MASPKYKATVLNRLKIRTVESSAQVPPMSFHGAPNDRLVLKRTCQSKLLESYKSQTRGDANFRAGVPSKAIFSSSLLIWPVPHQSTFPAARTHVGPGTWWC